MLPTTFTLFSIVHITDNYLPRVVGDLNVCTFHYLDRCRNTRRHRSKWKECTKWMSANESYFQLVLFNDARVQVYCSVFLFHLVSSMFYTSVGVLFMIIIIHMHK